MRTPGIYAVVGGFPPNANLKPLPQIFYHSAKCEDPFSTPHIAIYTLLAAFLFYSCTVPSLKNNSFKMAVHKTRKKENLFQAKTTPFLFRFQNTISIPNFQFWTIFLVEQNGFFQPLDFQILAMPSFAYWAKRTIVYPYFFFFSSFIMT
mgnify:CR=1 FL=1